MLPLGPAFQCEGDPGRGDRQQPQLETSNGFQRKKVAAASRFPSKSRQHLKSPELPALERVSGSNNGHESFAAPGGLATARARKPRQKVDPRFPGIGNETSAIYARADRTRQRLTPLPRRSKLQLLDREAVAAAEEQARVSSTIAVRLD